MHPFFLAKAHYAHQVWDPVKKGWCSTLYGIRGARIEKGYCPHPYYKLLKDLSERGSSFGENLSLTYDHVTLLRLAQWNKILRSPQTNFKDIRPGKLVIQERILRMKNTNIPVKNLKEYQKRVRRDRSGIPLFERYLPLGIYTVLEQMLHDTLKEQVDLIERK